MEKYKTIQEKIEKISEVLECFDNNIVFYDIFENGKLSRFILANEYLYLKSQIKAIIEQKGEK